MATALSEPLVQPQLPTTPVMAPALDLTSYLPRYLGLESMYCTSQRAALSSFNCYR